MFTRCQTRNNSRRRRKKIKKKVHTNRRWNRLSGKLSYLYIYICSRIRFKPNVDGQLFFSRFGRYICVRSENDHREVHLTPVIYIPLCLDEPYILIFALHHLRTVRLATATDGSERAQVEKCVFVCVFEEQLAWMTMNVIFLFVEINVNKI